MFMIATFQKYNFLAKNGVSLLICYNVNNFILAIVFSSLLRYTDSVYPFGIFKLFLTC